MTTELLSLGAWFEEYFIEYKKLIIEFECPKSTEKLSLEKQAPVLCFQAEELKQ